MLTWPERADPHKRPEHHASDRAFALGERKARAWDQAGRIADYCHRTLQAAGYAGPLAIAGGYVRDTALGRVPKDLDVFLDVDYAGGIIMGGHWGQLLGAVLTGFGGRAPDVKPIQCYGTWAADVAHVVQVAWGNDAGSHQVGGLSVPPAIDIVVLDRKHLLANGYTPGDSPSFLRAVCNRLDLRLNAIGASAVNTYEAIPGWNDDAMAERLVVQHARADEDMARITKRLDRFTGEGGKYAGWARFLEQQDGSLVQC